MSSDKVTAIYHLSKISDIQEYNSLVFVDDSVTLREHEEDYENAYSDFDPDLDRKNNCWQPVHLAKIWNTPKVTCEKKYPVHPWLDYPCLGLIPAFSRRAVDALRDLLEPNGELLPLDSDIGEYYAYNITTVADVLNQERSCTFNGCWDITVWSIRHYEFFADRLDGLSIFKIKQQMDATLVTNIFAERVRKHQLQGFNLAKVWPLVPGEMWWKMQSEQKHLWARQAKNKRRKGWPKDKPPLEMWKDIIE